MTDSLTTLCSLLIVTPRQGETTCVGNTCHIPPTWLTSLPFLFIHALFSSHSKDFLTRLEYTTISTLINIAASTRVGKWGGMNRPFDCLFFPLFLNFISMFFNIFEISRRKQILYLFVFLVYLPSLFIPICKHFFNRHAWHWFLWALSTTQRPVPAWHLWEIKGVHFSFCCSYLGDFYMVFWQFLGLTFSGLKVLDGIIGLWTFDEDIKSEIFWLLSKNLWRCEVKLRQTD